LGQDEHLTILQMSLRGGLFFIYCLALIRLSGRRSFGLHNPLDNIIAILLGAIMSRAVVGASPILPVAACCLVMVLIHRGISWMTLRAQWFSRIVEGNKIPVFQNGKMEKENLAKGLISEEDVMQGIRKSALTDNLTQIDRVYLERNGEISALKKRH
jgi:uncharacterized membrane protein YcaP (DUF421 family)